MASIYTGQANYDGQNWGNAPNTGVNGPLAGQSIAYTPWDPQRTSVSTSVPGGSRTSDPTRAGTSSYDSGNLSGGGNAGPPNGPPPQADTPAPQYNQWTVPTGPMAGTPFVNTTLGNNTIGPFQQPAGGWDARNVIQQYMQDPGWVNSWVNSASLALDPATGRPRMSANAGLPQVQLGQQGLSNLLSGTGGALAGVGAPPSATLPANYAQNYQAASGGGSTQGLSAQYGGGNTGNVTQSGTPGPSWQGLSQTPDYYRSIINTLFGLGNMGARGTGYGVQTTPLGYTQYQPQQTNASSTGLDQNTLGLLAALFGGQSRNAPTSGLQAILGLLGGL